MSTVCHSGSCEHIQYSIIELEEGFQAAVDDKTDIILRQDFTDYHTAVCWIKRIINEHGKNLNEIDRYS